MSASTLLNLPNSLNKRYKGDFLHAIQTNNIKLLEDLTYDKKITQKESEIVCNYIAEFGTIRMMKKALELGYTFNIETICNALNESKIEMCKLLLTSYTVRNGDIEELTISFNIAVEEENEKVIKFLKKYKFYKKLNQSLMTEEALDIFIK